MRLLLVWFYYLDSASAFLLVRCASVIPFNSLALALVGVWVFG